MAPQLKKEKFQQLTEFGRGRISSFREGGFFFIAQQQLVCKRTILQWWELGNNGPTSTEQLGKLQLATEGDVSAQRSTPAPHGGEWSYSFFQEVGSTLVYGFINSSTSAAPWTSRKGAFIRDPPHANHQRLRLQWAHEHRASQTDCYQVVFYDE